MSPTKSDTTPPVVEKLRFSVAQFARLTLQVVWALWWGGLTFYSAVVVPLGANLFGGMEQGFLTQRVTVRLNVLGTLVLVLVAADAVWHRRRVRLALTIGLAAVQLLLWYWHGRLDAMLDSDARMLLAPDTFYGEHRVYLWLTALQWLLGLCIMPSPVALGSRP